MNIIIIIFNSFLVVHYLAILIHDNVVEYPFLTHINPILLLQYWDLIDLIDSLIHSEIWSSFRNNLISILKNY